VRTRKAVLSVWPIALGLAVASALVTACSSSPDRERSNSLQMIGTPSGAGVLEDHIPVGSPYLFSLDRVCVKGAHATVTNVHVTNTQGSIYLVDWGTRRLTPTAGYTDDEDPGAQPGLVSSVRGFGHEPVTTKCSDVANGEMTEIDVSVTSGTTEPAISRGFTVSYTSGGKNGSLFLPFEAALCSAACPPGVAQDPRSVAPTS
jgi:hypothetical protein